MLNHSGKRQWNSEQSGQTFAENSPVSSPFPHLTGGLGQVSGQFPQDRSSTWGLTHSVMLEHPPGPVIPDWNCPGPGGTRCSQPFTGSSSVRQGRGRRAGPRPGAGQGRAWNGEAPQLLPLPWRGQGAEHRVRARLFTGQDLTALSLGFGVILLHHQKAERISVLGSLELVGPVCPVEYHCNE